jgi:hypothetical protein
MDAYEKQFWGYAKQQFDAMSYALRHEAELESVVNTVFISFYIQSKGLKKTHT